MECKYCGKKMDVVSETGASIVGYWEVWHECPGCHAQYYESEVNGEGWTEPTANSILKEGAL